MRKYTEYRAVDGAQKLVRAKIVFAISFDFVFAAEKKILQVNPFTWKGSNRPLLCREWIGIHPLNLRFYLNKTPKLLMNAA